MIPEVKYADSGGVNIAYQDFGTGEIPLVVVPGWVSHAEVAWEVPYYGEFLQRLGAAYRVLLIDRRGTGLSDPVDHVPTLEQRMDDVRAVLDHAGVDSAALLGISEGGPLCMLFAATFPQRTRALVLYGTFARNLRDEDYPWAPPAEAFERFLERLTAGWGTGIGVEAFAPSMKSDEDFIRQWGKLERMAASPGQIRRILEMSQGADVRDVLPTISVPALVLHRVGDRVTRIGGARYLAEHIPGARLVELKGEDHFPWLSDVDALLDELNEFLLGQPAPREPERILATVLFMDIVNSSQKAAEMGDSAWRQMLQRYRDVADRHVARFGGRVIDTAGDGHFASFDGPARAVRCALATRHEVEKLGLAIRAGVHTGECEILGDGLSGIAVHLGARIAAAAEPGEVLVSSTVKDLVFGSGLQFQDCGEHSLKGIPSQWRVYRAEA